MIVILYIHSLQNDAALLSNAMKRADNPELTSEIYGDIKRER